MHAAESVAETLRQVLHGRDFEPPHKLLESITPINATVVPPGCPYSIATNVAHAEQWQRTWIHKLLGLPKFEIWGNVKDFPAVATEDWPRIREEFLNGMAQALAIAEAEVFAHHMKTDEAAVRALNQIAVHGAYHVGQVRLLKRILWSTRADR